LVSVSPSDSGEQFPPRGTKFYSDQIVSDKLDPRWEREIRFSEKFYFIRFLGLLSDKMNYLRMHFQRRNAPLASLHDDLFDVHEMLDKRHNTLIQWIHEHFGERSHQFCPQITTLPPAPPELALILTDVRKSYMTSRENFVYHYSMKLFHKRVEATYRNVGALPDGRFPHELPKTHPIFVKLPNHLRNYTRRDYPLSRQLMPKFIHHMSLLEPEESKLFLRFFEHAT
jgi:hypothetical protein